MLVLRQGLHVFNYGWWRCVFLLTAAQIANVARRRSHYCATPCCSINRSASSADLLPAAVPILFDSVVENNGLRRGENFVGSNVPRFVWNTQTYSRRFLSASDGETTAVSIVVRGVKSENPFLSV